MNKLVVKFYSDDDMGIVEEVFEDVVAHQVGGGCVQVVMKDGVQRIINKFLTVDVVPDEADQQKFLDMAAQAYAKEQEGEDEKSDPAVGPSSD